MRSQGGQVVPTKNPLIQLNMPEELIRRIDDYRFTNRFPSRAAAIKDLITKALDAEQNKQDTIIADRPSR
jgi:Arc/MetJ-type ribon-helix-helix transcriptional regulator